MSELTLRIRPKSKVTKTDIENVSIALLALVGIMQTSEIFYVWDEFIDAIKFLIFLLSIVVLYLQLADLMLSYRSFARMLFIVGILTYTCIRTKNFSFLLICLFLLTGRSTTIENFVKRSLKILIIFGGGHILLWCVNTIIPLGLTIYTNESERRIAFGFTHPNICAIKFGWGILMYLWLNWNHMTKRKWGLLYTLSAMFYVATKSDSWLIIFFILILAGFRKNKILRRFISAFSRVAFPVFGIFNILTSYYFLVDGRLSNYSLLLDKLFNRRISMGYLAIKENGLTVLGQAIRMNHDWDPIFNYNGYTIDSTYIYLSVCVGIIYFALISIGFFKLGKYKSYKTALIIIAFSLFCLIEVHSIYLSNSFAILLLKAVIFKEKELQ